MKSTRRMQMWSTWEKRNYWKGPYARIAVLKLLTDQRTKPVANTTRIERAWLTHALCKSLYLCVFQIPFLFVVFQNNPSYFFQQTYLGLKVLCWSTIQASTAAECSELFLSNLHGFTWSLFEALKSLAENSYCFRDDCRKKNTQTTCIYRPCD